MNDFFHKLLKRPEQDAENDEQQLQLAAAALMLELVRADGKIDPQELNCMADVLRQQFALEKGDLEELLTLAEKEVVVATDLHVFTREIRTRWDNQQRVKLVQNLWLIALADEQIDAHERHLVRKVAGLLHLTEKQIMLTRESAKRQLQTQGV